MLELKTDVMADAEYEQDLVLWYEGQIALLRERRLDKLDIDNLIEELRAAMIKERRELASRLRILLMHLLKCQLQPHRVSGNWLGTLVEQRNEIDNLLEDSPSLRATVMQVADKVYPAAVRLAANETRLPISAFPSSNPYSTQQLLDYDFVA
jgi:predicted DNA-binding ribbon-helix-helix protein